MAVEEFGRAVMVIGHDDQELRRGLKLSETAITQSALKMQNSLNKVSTSMGEAGESTVSTGALFSTFGIQAAAMGGRVGRVGGLVASLGASFATLGTALFGLPGILLAVGAGAAFLAHRFFAAKRRTKEFTESLTVLGEESRVSAALTDKAIGGIEDRLITLAAAARGPADVIEAAGALASRTAQRQATAIQTQIDATRKKEQALREDIEKRLAVFDKAERKRRARAEAGFFIPGEGPPVPMAFKPRELPSEITKAQETLAGLPALPELERQLGKVRELLVAESQNTARQLAALESQQAEEARMKRKAADDRRLADQRLANDKMQALFKQTAAGQVVGAILDTIQERRQKAQIKALTDSPLLKLLLPGGFGKDVLSRLGISAPIPQVAAAVAGPQGGSLALSSFGRTGAGRGAADAAAAGQMTKERRETTQASDIGEIKKSVLTLAGFLQRANFFGGASA